jgi:uncharacterized membrane protein YkoI
MVAMRKSIRLAVMAALVLVLAVSPFGAVAAESGYIGAEKAKSVALGHAKVAAAQVAFVRANLDYDDGRVVYDVDFYSGNTEYDYEIDALTGEIREFDRDIEYYVIPGGSRATTDAGRYIGEASAREIALAHAKVSASEAVFMKAHLDSDDGRVVYDVEFYSGNTEYDYEIDAATGELVEFDRDIEYYAIPKAPASKPAAPAPGGNIGEARAKQIALSHAGVAEAQASRLRVKLDRDDGRTTYEVDFNVGRMEYEYEIDAATGIILESDAEYDD